MARALLASVVSKIIDETSGAHYYFNSLTGETSWSKPALFGSEVLRHIYERPQCCSLLFTVVSPSKNTFCFDINFLWLNVWALGCAGCRELPAEGVAYGRATRRRPFRHRKLWLRSVPGGRCSQHCSKQSRKFACMRGASRVVVIRTLLKIYVRVRSVMLSRHRQEFVSRCPRCRICALSERVCGVER